MIPAAVLVTLAALSLLLIGVATFVPTLLKVGLVVYALAFVVGAVVLTLSGRGGR